ncbi:hypothetical protein AAHE18_16G135000 [Arachis hypogaea]|nr:uncharacterized protein DS421_16g543220 [Arachis hypogaea]
MFAFIRYTTRRGAMKVITEMHHARIRGKIISVGQAKYRRAMGGENDRVRKEDLARTKVESRQIQKGESSTKVEETKKVTPVKDTQGNGWTKKVEVPVAKENFDWLLRSLVGETTRAIDFKSLRRAIVKNFPQVVEVRELGAYKALLVFDSVKSAEEAYTFKMNSFLQFFYNVWRWEESERSESRRVWLECHGVPLHV